MRNETRQLTALRRYYLVPIWSFRVFGVIFTAISLLVTPSNFLFSNSEPTGGDAAFAALTVIFIVVGCGIYFGATRILRSYRRALGLR